MLSHQATTTRKSNTTMTPAQIRQRYSDRYEYYRLCVDVSQARDTENEAVACRVLRVTMVNLGYPAETATWDDARTMMYADNIVCMG